MKPKPKPKPKPKRKYKLTKVTVTSIMDPFEPEGWRRTITLSAPRKPTPSQLKQINIELKRRKLPMELRYNPDHQIYEIEVLGDSWYWLPPMTFESETYDPVEDLNGPLILKETP